MTIRFFTGGAAIAEAPRHRNVSDHPVMLMLAVISIPLASSALVLRAAIWLELSFHVASCVLAATVVSEVMLAGVWLLLVRPRLTFSSEGWDKTAMLALSIACASTVLAALFLHHSDADDIIYLPKIVFAVAHPDVPMDGVIHELAHAPPLALPLSAAAYYPTAYEFSQAAFSHFAGLDLPWVYYRLAPVLTALFGVLLLAANLRILGFSGRAAAISTLLLIPLLLLMGDSHRSFGNFTILRLFQAKCAFIFLGLQIFIALSLLFFRKPNPGRWTLLIVGVLAVSSMTTSALVMLPLLSLPLFLSWWLAFGQGASLGSSMIRGVAYAMTLSPALAFAWDYRRYAIERVAYGSSINAGFPRTFHGQLDLVTGGTALSASVVLFLCSILIIGFRWREGRHRFLLALSVLVVALYLNPWVAPAIMRYLTTENIYWRLFFLVPLPLLIGTAAGTLLDRIPGDTPLRRNAPFVAFFVLAAAVFISPTSIMRPGNHVRVSFSGYPMDANANDARRCLRLARPGVVLAPIPLAQDMAMLSAQHTQIVTRRDFLRNALSAAPEDFAQRVSAAAFIEGNGGHIEDFVGVMRRLKPSTVVVAKKALSKATAKALEEQDLHPDGAVGHWVVYGRARPARASTLQPDRIRP